MHYLTLFHRAVFRLFVPVLISYLAFLSVQPRSGLAHDHFHPGSAYQGGEWSAVENWPVLAVHANLLPTGEVLAWDATPDDFDDDPHTTDNYTTRVTRWNPVWNTHYATNNGTDTDLFCAGSAQLWDGRVVFAGGDSEREGLNGPLSNANLYDPYNNTWQRIDNMHAARWYSSVASLANGELLTLGGTYSPNPLGEVLQTDRHWRRLDVVPPYSLSGDYQWLQSVGDGSVMYLGPHNMLSSIDTSGSGHWHEDGIRDSHGYRGYGSYAMYNIGKVLVAGGGNSLRSSVIVDTNTKRARETNPMNHGRRQHNLTILADGSVLATGGNSNGADLIDIKTGVHTAEIWNPTTERWHDVNAMKVNRQYHSVSLLLPDGRVLLAGGGYCGPCAEQGYHEQNAEVYSPPYLFNDDNSLATRPQIVYSPPQADYKRVFSVELGEFMSIDSAHLIKLGSVTHSQNQEQRLVPLNFWQTQNMINLTAPASRHIAPPGHYMLFLVANGVPSVASIMKIGQPILYSDQAVRHFALDSELHHFRIDATGSTSKLAVSLRSYNSEAELFVSTSQPSDSNQLIANAICQSRQTGTDSQSCLADTTPGQSYYITVRTLGASSYSLQARLDNAGALPNLADSEIDPVLTPTTPISAQRVPTQPANLRGRLYSTNSLEIFWDASVDNNAVAGYEVYRDGVLYQTTGGRSLMETSLSPTTTHTYSIVAYDLDGNRSEPSLSLSLSTANYSDGQQYAGEIVNPPQSVPGDLASHTLAGLYADVYSGTAVELFWQHPVEGVEFDYQVSQDGVAMTNTSGSSYFTDKLDSGNTYQFALETRYEGVRYTGSLAVTTAGGEVNTADTPAQPQNSNIKPPSGLHNKVYSATAAELFWEPSASHQYGYHLYLNGQYIGHRNGLSYYTDNLEAGGDYEFGVHALNADGQESQQAATTALNTPDLDMPQRDPEPNQQPDQQPDPLPETPTDPAIRLALVSATSDGILEPYGNIADGNQIDLRGFANQPVSIQAFVNSPLAIRMVEFDFNGIRNFRRERVFPYILHGDINGNINGVNLDSGQYSLTVRVDFSNGSNEVRTINFTIVSD